MAIKQLDSGKFQLDFYPNGRESKRIKRIFNTHQEAFDFKNEVLSAKEYGHNFYKGHNPTLSDLINQWFNFHGHTLKTGMARREEMLVACHKMNNPLATKFTAQTFIRYRNNRIGQGMSPNTLNHDLTYFNAMFNQLYDSAHFPYPNPLKKVNKLKFQQIPVTCLNEKQIIKLFEALSKKKGDSYLVSLLCLSTGARWSEAVNLAFKDISNGQVIFGNTKNNKPRYVPINSALERLLKIRLVTSNFKNPNSTFKRVFKLLGLDKVTPKGQLTHLLRHSFASFYLKNGGDILSLQKALGHSTINMTMRYVHFAEDFLKDVPYKNPASTILFLIDPENKPLRLVKSSTK